MSEGQEKLYIPLFACGPEGLIKTTRDASIALACEKYEYEYHDEVFIL